MLTTPTLKRESESKDVDFYLSEQRTLNFYLWEHRGRGWDVYDSEVFLEPAFHPFHFDSDLSVSSYFDDPLKMFFHYFKKGLTEGLKPSVSGSTFFPFESGETTTDELKELKPIIISIKVSSEGKTSLLQLKQFLVNLSYCHYPVGFEIIGLMSTIELQLTCFEPDLTNVLQQTQVHFPFLSVAKDVDKLSSFWNQKAAKTMVDFGLEQEFMRPLQVYSSLEPDPLTGVIGSLEELREGEIGILQVLFQAVRNPWGESIIHSVSDEKGKSLIADAPEMVSLAREKVNQPLFACVVRVGAQAISQERSTNIAKNISSGLKIVTRPESNSLIPLSETDYRVSEHENDLLLRRSHRTGMILNAMELGMIVHPPSSSIISPKIQKSQQNAKAVPREVIGNVLVLGENVYRNSHTVVTLSLEQRLRHVYIIGATGTGKSTLLLNLVRQRAEEESFVLLDPHGDLIDKVLEYLPEKRYDDIIVFDPADAEYPVGFNILQTRSEVEKNVLASDLVSIFKRFSTSWGDQMSAVLGNAISVMLESPRPLTLIDLRHFLADSIFRKSVLETVADSHVRYFWEKEFPLLKGNSENSILTRLDSFLRPKIIRNIIQQSEGLNFFDIVNGKKILLVKLAQGIIGEENAHLLGSLLISKLHQIILARQLQNEEEREPFFLYLDEFQNFITPSMTAILSGGRKYMSSITMCHQDLKQLWNYDTGLANSVISNAATRICFRLGDFDAEKLQSGFSFFDSSDLQNLGVGEAICRVEQKDHDFNLRTFEAPKIAVEEGRKKREMIISISRNKYGLRGMKDIELGYEPKAALQKPIQSSVSSSKGLKKIHSVSEKTYEIREPLTKTIFGQDESRRKEISQHRYLQTLIKKMAEQRGYRAVVEEPTPDGSGRVDVGLERHGKKIAVEISVTTGDIQELHNVEKCLKAGYGTVIVCSAENKNLEAIRKFTSEKLEKTELDKVKFFEPQELFLFLDQQVAESSSSEQRIKGYRVKVKYEAVSEVEKKQKREAVAQVIVNAIKRIK